MNYVPSPNLNSVERRRLITNHTSIKSLSNLPMISDGKLEEVAVQFLLQKSSLQQVLQSGSERFTLDFPCEHVCKIYKSTR